MVSFDFRDYPDATGQCALCKRYDCSKGDEKWLHLLTVEDTPSIGLRCLRSIVENSPLKPQPIVTHEVRPPTDEEIGAYVRKLVEHAGTHSSDTPSTHTPDVGEGPKPTRQGTSGTPSEDTGGKPQRVRGSQSGSRSRTR